MKTIALFISLVFTFCGNIDGQSNPSDTNLLEIHYINVGQADAILVECPTKEHFLLIDAADTKYPGSSADFKKDIEKLTSGLHKKIDVVVASHNHSDHIGNMKWVLDNYRVVKFVDNGHNPGTVLYKNLIKDVKDQVKKKKLIYKSAESVDANFVDFCPLKNCDAEIIHVKNAYGDCKNQNNCSVIIKVIYGTTSFLFVGDAEDELESEIMKDSVARKEIDSDVLKGGHHGSTTSSTLDFVKAVSPDIVVVSCGKKNIGTNKGYKHPQLASLKSFNEVLKTPEYRTDLIEVYDHDLAKWKKEKVKKGIYYTKVDGEVVILSDGTKFWKK